MTEAEIKTILIGISHFWNTLTPNEVKSLLRILASHGEFPTCSACGKPITDFKEFSWDHIVAKSQGGPNEIGNMTPMHVKCNGAKGSKMDEAVLCHVDPELLKTMEPICKSSPKKPKKKHYEDVHKHRNHLRIKGWTDFNGYRR
ncbi:MAG: HNH endonuclease [Alphaproteobacteria bacterium]|nr:HNH endonuclease [Alphaproteobacteria bacterium]